MANSGKVSLRDRTLRIIASKVGDERAKDLEERFDKTTEFVTKTIKDKVNEETIADAGKMVGRGWSSVEAKASSFRKNDLPQLKKSAQVSRDAALQTVETFRAKTLADAKTEAANIFERSSKKSNELFLDLKKSLHTALIRVWKWTKRLLILTALVLGVLFIYIVLGNETSPNSGTGYRDPANDFVLRLLDIMCARGDMEAC